MHASATLDAWLPSLSGAGSFGATLADWAADHRGSLGTLATLALIAALLALAGCIWRAFRFTQPLFRGASLLKLDLETRRRDLDSLIANQTRRVDAIGTEADAYTRRAEEAERRARAAESAPSSLAASLAESPFEPAPGEADHKARLAAAFITSLDAAIARGGERATDAPQRILVAIDDLDALQPAQAAAFVSTAHRLLSARNFAIVLTADADRLASRLGRTIRRRIKQIRAIAHPPSGGCTKISTPTSPDRSSAKHRLGRSNKRHPMPVGRHSIYRGATARPIS